MATQKILSAIRLASSGLIQANRDGNTKQATSYKRILIRLRQLL